MSVVFAPSWGADIGAALQKMGTGIRDIINPNVEAQQQFLRQLQDPNNVEKFAQTQYENPTVFENNPMVNNKAREILKTLKPSQEYMNKRAVQSAIATNYADPRKLNQAAAQQGGFLTDNQQRIQDAQVATADINLETLKRHEAWLKLNPDAEARGFYHRTVGDQPERIKELERLAGLREVGRTMSAAEARKLFDSDNPDDTYRLSAFIETHPEQYKMMVDALDFQRRAAHDESMLSIRIGNDDKDRQYNSLDMTARSLAQEYNIPYQVAVKVLGYDKMDTRFKTTVQGVTPEQVTAYQNQIAQIDKQKEQKALIAQNRYITGLTASIDNAIRMLEDKTTTGENRPARLANLQTQLQLMSEATGRVIRVKQSEGGFLRRSGRPQFIDAEGKPLKESDILNPAWYDMNGMGAEANPNNPIIPPNPADANNDAAGNALSEIEKELQRRRAGGAGRDF